jgi:peroxiredoxin
VVIDAKYKSLFIFPATIVLALIVVLSLVMAAISVDARVAWIGAMMAALPLPILFAMLTLRPTPRTSENLPLLTLVGAAGVMLAFWEQFIEADSGWAPTVTAIVAGILFLMYLTWYSRFGRFDSAQLMVGGKLPAFSLTDAAGKVFDSSSLLGSPAVVLFFRGNWCPLCMAQIREIADKYQEMDAMGIKVVLVSPQSGDYSRELAARYDVPFIILVDEGNELAESLGIAINNGVPVGIPGDYDPDTVMPTVVVTNENGTILFSDQTDNYRVRPEPDIFLAILRRAGVKPA